MRRNQREGKVSASLEIQHENMTADRWRVMLRVNGVAFAIGAECKTLHEAQHLRFDFRMALFQLIEANHVPKPTPAPPANKQEAGK